MLKSEVISRVIATGQQEGAKAMEIRRADGSAARAVGDPKLLAAARLERQLSKDAEAVPAQSELTAAHFADLRAALLRSLAVVDGASRATLEKHGLPALMQSRLKSLELLYAAEKPQPLVSLTKNILAWLKERLFF